MVEKILHYAPKTEDPQVALLLGHNGQAANLTMLGEFNRALEHADEVIDIYDYQKHRSLVLQTGVHVMPVSMVWSVIDLWFLGYPGVSEFQSFLFQV